MDSYIKSHPKVFIALAEETTIVYNEMIDRRMADTEARKADASNIQTPKGD